MGNKAKSKCWDDDDFYVEDQIDFYSNDETVSDYNDEYVYIYVNGFHVRSSDEVPLRQIFERHPDLASDFCIKTEALKSYYIDLFLNLIDILRNSPHELKEYDLDTADNMFSDLVHAGFKLDWLKNKLEEVRMKKKKEKCSDAKIKEIEEKMINLKLLLSDLEREVEKEKANVKAATTCFDFDDLLG